MIEYSNTLGGGGSSTATLPDQISNLACTGGTDGTAGTIDISFTEVPATSFDLLKYYILIYKVGGIPQTPFDGVRITLQKATAGAKLEHQITGLTFDQLYGVRIYPVSVKNQFQTLAEGATATAKPVEYTLDNQLFGCDYHNIYELDPDTLSPIRQVVFSSSDNNYSGIGGIKERLYFCNDDKDKVYELSGSSLTPIKTVNSPSENPRDIGGIYNRLYNCSAVSDRIYELDIDTLLPIKTFDPGREGPNGIGGIYNRLYHCDDDLHKLYELDVDSLTPIKSVNAPAEYAAGTGGIKERLYHCTFIGKNTYELDINTLIPIKNVEELDLKGIGGTK